MRIRQANLRLTRERHRFFGLRQRRVSEREPISRGGQEGGQEALLEDGCK
jgi:hypothetical protein